MNQWTKRPLSAPERFWLKVQKSDGCWRWQAYHNREDYGWFWSDGKNTLAHRYAWELERGPIPEGMTIDHLCRVRDCVRVDHLEVVTTAENTRRGTTGKNTGAMQKAKTHCPRGHAYTPENTRLHGPTMNWRRCRTCSNLHLPGKEKRALALAAPAHRGDEP